MHLDLSGSLSLTMFAAAALDIEAKPSRLVPAYLGLARHRKQRADQIEHARIGRRIAARRTADGRLVDLNDLVDLRGADDIFVLAGFLAGTVQPAFERLEQNLRYERTFTGTGDAGYTGQYAQRKLDADFLEIVCLGLPYFEGIAQTHLASSGWQFNAFGPAHILTGDRSFTFFDGVQRADDDHLAAVFARGRADVNDMVRRGDHIVIMLNDQNGIADVAQFFQDFHQPVIIAAMQADGRLIQHITAPHQSAADLGGQTNPLGLAAGERPAGSIQCQIAQPHIYHKLQTGTNLFKRLGGDECFFFIQFQGLEIIVGLFDTHPGYGADAFIADGYRGRFLSQSCAAALAARRFGQIAMQPRFNKLAGGVLPAMYQVGYHAFKTVAVFFYILFGRAVHQNFSDRSAKCAERIRLANAKIAAEPFDHPVVIDVHSFAAFTPGLDGAVFQ